MLSSLAGHRNDTDASHHGASDRLVQVSLHMKEGEKNSSTDLTTIDAFHKECVTSLPQKHI